MAHVTTWYRRRDMHMRYCLLLALVVACSKHSGDSTAGSGSGSGGSGGSSGSAGSSAEVGSGSGSAGSAEEAVPAGSVALYVDDERVALVTPEDIAKWPRVDSLVPEDDRRLGAWKTIYLKNRAGKVAELNQPSATYPEMVGALFPGDGSPSFGMFDPVELAKHGEPGLRHDDLREVRIVKSKIERGGPHQGSTGAGDPLELKLTFQIGKTKKALTGEQILALPRVEMPGRPETKGWYLTKLIDAVGIKKFKKLILIDAAGTSLVLEHKEFDDKTVIPFIKLNRQGALRFRMLKKQGEGWQYAGDLRALTTVKVD